MSLILRFQDGDGDDGGYGDDGGNGHGGDDNGDGDGFQMITIFRFLLMIMIIWRRMRKSKKP